MNPVHIAIVAQLNGLTPGIAGLLARAAAAIQVQVTFEFFHAWMSFNVPPATVAAYPSMADAPRDAWFVLLVTDANGRAGFHVPPAKLGEPAGGRLSQSPFAVVQYRSDGLWTYTLSHEILEMLVDPSGDRKLPGDAPYQTGGLANYLVEVCDPCQDLQFAYTLPSFPDIWLCDFCFPAYYGLGNGTTYTRQGAVGAPFLVGDGGCLSFFTEKNGWQQLTPQGVAQVALDSILGVGGNIRGQIDRAVGHYEGPKHHLNRGQVRGSGVRNPSRRRSCEPRSSGTAVIKHANSLGIVV